MTIRVYTDGCGYTWRLEDADGIWYCQDGSWAGSVEEIIELRGESGLVAR